MSFMRANDIPVVKSTCPMDKHTKREYVKNIKSKLEKENEGSKADFSRQFRKGKYRRVLLFRKRKTLNNDMLD